MIVGGRGGCGREGEGRRGRGGSWNGWSCGEGKGEGSAPTLPLRSLSADLSLMQMEPTSRREERDRPACRRTEEPAGRCSVLPRTSTTQAWASFGQAVPQNGCPSPSFDLREGVRNRNLQPCLPVSRRTQGTTTETDNELPTANGRAMHRTTELHRSTTARAASHLAPAAYLNELKRSAPAGLDLLVSCCAWTMPSRWGRSH